MSTYFGISQFITTLIAFIYVCVVSPGNAFPEILVIITSVVVMAVTQQLVATYGDDLFETDWHHTAHAVGLGAVCLISTFLSSSMFSKQVDAFTLNFGENIVRDNEAYIFIAVFLAAAVIFCFILYPFMHMRSMGLAYLLAFFLILFTGWWIYAFWAGILQWLILIGLGAIVLALLPAGGVLVIIVLKD